MSDATELSPGHRQYLARQAERVEKLGSFLAEAFGDGKPVTLEIGCGHGHYLTAYSEAHPGEKCLGIDIVTKRIEKACRKRDKRGLDNLHFLKAEVRELFMAWPESVKLGRIFILFPDPWPKKRHIKNRIIQAGLLDELARHAIPGAQLHFRTDHEGNFQWGLETIAEHSGWNLSEEAAWPFESSSFFQDLLGNRFSLTAEVAL